jgi:plastocyanin
VKRGLIAAAAAASALVAPTAAQADQVIAMPGKYFTPSRVTVLTGDPVTWRNDDVINHDVAAVGAFVSGPLSEGSAYTFSFAAPGTYAYRCTIHAFMSGSVTVAPVTLDEPQGTVLAGDGVQLSGRAPVGTARVAIERSLDGATWADTGVGAVPDAQGAFSAMVPAAAGTVFRAAVAAGTSGVVTPKVAARVPLAIHVARTKRHATVHVRTAAEGAGLYATLETYRRERFWWRPLGRPVRLDRRGNAAIRVPVGLEARARIVLRAKRGDNALLTSRPVRLSDGRPTSSPIPEPPAEPEGGGHAMPGATDGQSGTAAPDAADPHGGHPPA